MVVFIGLFHYKKNIKMVYKILWISLGILSCLAVKLIFNYFAWVNFFAISGEFLDTIMFPVIVPYNLIKLIVTVAAALFLEKPVKKILRSLER